MWAIQSATVSGDGGGALVVLVLLVLLVLEVLLVVEVLLLLDVLEVELVLCVELVEGWVDDVDEVAWVVEDDDDENVV